jgi:hypothetical protein
LLFGCHSDSKHVANAHAYLCLTCLRQTCFLQKKTTRKRWKTREWLNKQEASTRRAAVLARLAVLELLIQLGRQDPPPSVRLWLACQLISTRIRERRLCASRRPCRHDGFAWLHQTAEKAPGVPESHVWRTLLETKLDQEFKYRLVCEDHKTSKPEDENPVRANTITRCNRNTPGASVQPSDKNGRRCAAPTKG